VEKGFEITHIIMWEEAGMFKISIEGTTLEGHRGRNRAGKEREFLGKMQREARKRGIRGLSSQVGVGFGQLRSSKFIYRHVKKAKRLEKGGVMTVDCASGIARREPTLWEATEGWETSTRENRENITD